MTLLELALDPRPYNFQRTNGTDASGNLSSSGSGKVITLTIFPHGMAVGNYVYISGGSGTAEAVIITAVSGSGGDATGTITVTTANTHTGAWVVSSSTAGIQESVVACASTFRAVLIPPGNYTIYSKLIIAAGISIRGFGIQSTTLTLATGFTSRFVDVTTPTGYWIDFGDMSIVYTSAGLSGEAIYLQEVTDGVISNLAIYNCYDAITGVSVGRVVFDNINPFPKHNAFNFSSLPLSGVIPVSVPIIKNGYYNMQSGTGSVINLAGTIAGIIIQGINTGLGAEGLNVVQSSGVINEIILADSIIDSFSGAGVNIHLSGTASMQRLTISNCMFAGQSPSANNLGILVQSDVAGAIQGVTISDNKVVITNIGNGINLQGIAGGVITGNTVATNAAGGTGLLLDGTANTDLLIEGNILGLGAAYTAALNPAQYGIFVNTQAHTRIHIKNNTLIGSTAGLSNSSTVAGGVRSQNNSGVDDVIPSAIASATSIAAPMNPVIEVSGTTTITTITGGWTGRVLQIIKTDSGSVTIGGGGNIPASRSLAQNGQVILVYNGTNWY